MTIDATADLTAKFFLCQEFVLATNLSTCPSARDKLKWAFKLYDKDESGLFFSPKRHFS